VGVEGRPERKHLPKEHFVNDNTTIPSNVSHLSRDPRNMANTVPTLGVSGSPRPAPKKFVAKGHDRQLEEAQFNNLPVRVRVLDTEYPLSARIVRRDKFTVTFLALDGHSELGVDEGDELLTYKHAIATIVINKRPQD
jgi:sRNA-binding regulator protein Hfq